MAVNETLATASGRQARALNYLTFALVIVTAVIATFAGLQVRS